MGEGKRADYERGIELGRAKVASAGLDAALAGEAVNSYALALERAYLLRDSWDRLGQPALARGSKGQPVPRPLITAIEAAERHLAAADAALTRRRVERRGNTTGSSLGQPRSGLGSARSRSTGRRCRATGATSRTGSAGPERRETRRRTAPGHWSPRASCRRRRQAGHSPSRTGLEERGAGDTREGALGDHGDGLRTTGLRDVRAVLHPAPPRWPLLRPGLSGPKVEALIAIAIRRGVTAGGPLF